MLVVVQGSNGLSGAEAKVARLMRSWKDKWHLPGLAVFDVNVPDERHGARQVDALMFTPHGLLVFEVKGFTRAQPGTLNVPLNGPWMVGQESAAIHTLAEGNPAEQVTGAVYATKNALAGMDGGPGFVTGVVVLVPQTKDLHLGDTERTGRGIHVALATQKSLRELVRPRATKKTLWTADRVGQACQMLELTGVLPRTEHLLAEGFPEQLPTPAPPAPAPPPQHRARPTPPRPAPLSLQVRAPAQPGPLISAAPPRPSTTLPPRPAAEPAREPARPRIPQQRPAPSQRPQTTPVPRPARRIPWGLLVALALIVTVGIMAMIAVNEMFAGR